VRRRGGKRIEIALFELSDQESAIDPTLQLSEALIRFSKMALRQLAKTVTGNLGLRAAVVPGLISTTSFSLTHTFATGKLSGPQLSISCAFVVLSEIFIITPREDFMTGIMSC
jgi:hypothetical protein